MQLDSDFYKPFIGLKEFMKKNCIVTMDCKVVNENLSFSEAMKGVREMDRSNIKVTCKHPMRKTLRLQSGEPKEQLKRVLEDDYTFNTADLPEYMEGAVEGISPLVMEKLRNGEFSIQKTLDLHGYNKIEAQILFEEFIRDAVRSQLNCVRVIHGRGLKSPHTPILKHSLTQWIVKAMNRKWVLAFASCKMCDGGPGATYILLKKRPEKRKITVIR
ncbi:MAG TPA: Smr/MutS family protein [Syntrophorhabdaceae bacterium]|mgnify:FL=1|nr:Smr/MutS family protein [Syntrophorhabdaceae bacterium]